MQRLNKAMENKLEGLDLYTSRLDSNLLSNPFFYENNGFYLIKKNSKEIKEINVEKIIKIYKDRTGYESSVNECKIEDYFKCEKKEELKIAMALSEVWKDELKRKFSDSIFYILVSNDGYSTTIRFYKYRENEAIWIDLDNINSYDEAIAVKITD